MHSEIEKLVITLLVMRSFSVLLGAPRACLDFREPTAVFLGSVVAALLHRAVGEQLTCVFVDNGLLRLYEGDQVMATFAEHMGVKVIRVDAEKRFLSALVGEADPEKKRKIIGNLFIEIFEEEAARLDGVKFLAQGTIYPDVIESAGAKSGKAHVIKSHHIVGGLPDYMTARFTHLPFEFLELVSRRIINEVKGISCVAYDISGPHQLLLSGSGKNY